ncbi:hypothetical protein CDL15_Pgr026482 [Punica granatum]|uniref:Beta-amyrin 28-monooxygenase-like n=1 Tax=Punica granatum TaxID=22663 RepID=A0A218WLC5_PUNGR|nr:hypothetical protein CDL15_Pgr026482 [Punica granatum]
MACRNLPPGTFGWPFLGETVEFIRAKSEGCADKFVKDRVERYGSTVFRTSLFGEPMAFLCGPAGNKFLFSNEGKKVAHWFPAPLRWMLEGSFIFMCGDEARVRKKLLTASFFNTESLMKCVPIMDEITRGYLKTHWEGKEEVQVCTSIKRYPFEVPCRLFMSIVEPELISRLLFQFNIFIKGLAGFPLNIPGTQFHRGMRAVNIIKRELRVVLRQRRAELARKVTYPTQDILSYLLVNADESGKFITEADIISEMLTLLFAGHDTSSSTISLLIKYLSGSPESMRKFFRVGWLSSAQLSF